MSCRCSPGIARQRAVACFSFSPAGPSAPRACSLPDVCLGVLDEKFLTEARNS